MSEYTTYEFIRQSVKNRWKRRTIWALDIVIFLSLGFILLIYDGRPNLSDFIGFVSVIFAVLLPLTILYTVYAVFAEFRDRALKREIERERRWRIVEQISNLPESQRAHVRFLLDEDAEEFDQLENWDEKPKRKSNFS